MPHTTDGDSDGGERLQEAAQACLGRCVSPEGIGAHWAASDTKEKWGYSGVKDPPEFQSPGQCFGALTARGPL